MNQWKLFFDALIVAGVLMIISAIIGLMLMVASAWLP